MRLTVGRRVGFTFAGLLLAVAALGVYGFVSNQLTATQLGETVPAAMDCAVAAGEMELNARGLAQVFAGQAAAGTSDLGPVAAARRRLRRRGGAARARHHHARRRRTRRSGSSPRWSRRARAW